MGHDRGTLASLGADTRAVHAGERAEPNPVIPTTTPIYQTSSFSYRSTDELDRVFDDNSAGYVYTRYGNPTIRALEQAVATLEGTEDAVAFPSGMAAIAAALMAIASGGDTVLASQDVYGATFALIQNELRRFGVTGQFVNVLDLADLERTARERKPAAILVETISNPLLRVADIPAIATIARNAGATLIVDNTFATPVLVNPAALGADLVIHSTTKYLGGHGDVTGGVIATNANAGRRLREQAKLNGAVAGPFDAWLTLRGIKTLPLRMRHQCASAATIADWLARHGLIERVYYPGMSAPLPEGQFHDGRGGAMVSFEIRDAGREEVFAFLDALQLCVPATTLGDVYSLVLYPAMSSHRALTPEQRASIGISESLVRLSVGIENVEDIMNDLDQALEACHRIPA